MALVLREIDVHLPFRVYADWSRDPRVRSPRESTSIRTTTGLEMFGANLANAYHSLQQDYGREHWDETLDLVRLGLGYHVESIDASTRFANSPGEVVLALRDRRFPREPIPASSLSDGQLAYLAFVALCRLNTNKSIVAFDEPELHLHPALLARVTGLLERLSQRVPVLIATHSNQLLDCLEDPVNSAVRCELNDQGASNWSRPDPSEYGTWLSQYAGLGAMRAAGVEPLVMTRGAQG